MQFPGWLAAGASALPAEGRERRSSHSKQPDYHTGLGAPDARAARSAGLFQARPPAAEIDRDPLIRGRGAFRDVMRGREILDREAERLEEGDVGVALASAHRAGQNLAQL